MEEEEDLGGVRVALREGEDVEVVVSDIEVLFKGLERERLVKRVENVRTLMPSCEKHGGTAEDSSSASERRTGNFSTADMGMSPL